MGSRSEFRLQTVPGAVGVRGRNEKGRPGFRDGLLKESVIREDYFFFAGLAFDFAAARFSSIAAWAAARRATGTRYGEQLT